MLLEAVSPQGYGVLMHLHYRDSLTPGSYPIAAPGDSNTVPRSTVAVRYLVREVTHGFPIDSGAVRVERSGHAVSAHIAGSGLENAIRAPAWIDFREVPLSSDTVPCRYQP
ncbi:MAG TPA: hypothetical protein VG454_17685 [Gemmatimonadales bacterium]|nr:hypothetical protein [Gemmatimonadales bacterium]